MEYSLASVIQDVSTLPWWAVFAVLFLSSTVEYVFPPFPGDTITLAGAILVTAAGYNAALMFGAVTGGSLAGSFLVYVFGTKLYQWWVRRKGGVEDPRLHSLGERFRRWGAAYIAINRFLPGVRSFIFVAAGLARLPAWKVMGWSALSLILWNGLVVAVGMALGTNMERMERVFREYTLAVWGVLGAVGLAWLVRALWRRLRSRRGR
jgi:membrane-associated protein